jgi:hypothetical protein
MDADRLALAGGGAAYTAASDPNSEFVGGPNVRIEYSGRRDSSYKSHASVWLEAMAISFHLDRW